MATKKQATDTQPEAPQEPEKLIDTVLIDKIEYRGTWLRPGVTYQMSETMRKVPEIAALIKQD